MSDVEPVQVHLVKSDVPVGGPGGGRQEVTSYWPACREVYQTVTLQAADPSQPILPASNARSYAVVIAVDQAVTVATREADAAAGTGALIPQGGPCVLRHSGAVYAAASGLTGTATARVSVIAVYEE